jgi:hypothetical protein
VHETKYKNNSAFLPICQCTTALRRTSFYLRGEVLTQDFIRPHSYRCDLFFYERLSRLVILYQIDYSDKSFLFI